ncbi:c-type cytochrome [sulfur-oxidizing endosymbiont of Gigantopelta aegis]|uniref:c-type cytochrome n=1 Tax=sulfur-oxidizing endosymbiont of Gigantopelta aegis TaxID=2794934 RepID=UPI0018DBCB89|nr:c-type cytochrome [sulfur-oxidizing endosymbiont of Gigantopelta aegis]
MSSSEEVKATSYFLLFPLLGSITLVVIWVFIILTSFAASFGTPTANAMDRTAVIERLKPIEVVALVEAKASVAVAPEKAAESDDMSNIDTSGIDANAIVTATCFACHSVGLLGSPKIGDKAAWDSRLQANGDLTGLVKSAITGKGAMPARGGNADLSNAEVQAAIEFMMK